MAAWQGLSSAISSSTPILGDVLSAGFSQQQMHNYDTSVTGQNLGAYDSNMVNAATSAGMSPLAMVGINPVGSTVSAPEYQAPDLASVGDSLVGAAEGQNLGRAISVQQDHKARLDDLQERLTEAQINKLDSDASVSRMNALSDLGTTYGQPGSPPPRPGSSASDISRSGFYTSGAFAHLAQIFELVDRWSKRR